MRPSSIPTFNHPAILTEWPADATPPLHPYLHGGRWIHGGFDRSPDPLRGYVWDPRFSTDPLEPLQCYAVLPVDATIESGTVDGLESLGRPGSILNVSGPVCLRVDFGVEAAAWLEFESSDLNGEVELSISEFNRPGIANAGAQSPRKTGTPERTGNTWRLRLNDLHYEGVRFGWIHVSSCTKPWVLRNLRAVCQVKPVNYLGSFRSTQAMLDRIWEAGAYSVKLNLQKDHFGSILTERGDRHSWTGDAYVTQAASLASFGNFAAVRMNTNRMRDDDNGIETYALYWIQLLADYVRWSGDRTFWESQITRVAAKLAHAANVSEGRDFLGYRAFCGHDDRLGAFAEDTPTGNLRLYRFLARRTATEVFGLLGAFPENESNASVRRAAKVLIATVDRLNATDPGEPGLHDGTEVLLAGVITDPRERVELAKRIYGDPIRAVSYSPFNNYFVLQGMAETEQWEAAGALLDRCWGGMLRLGATTFWESFRPEWLDCMKSNDPIFCGTQGYTSLCHPWSAGPTRWLSDHLLGVTPAAPGFSSIRVAPSNGLASEVSGSIPTPRGEIRIERNGAAINLFLPDEIRGSGPGGENLVPGENRLEERHRPSSVSLSGFNCRHEWEWLTDGDPYSELSDDWGWIAFAAGPDGKDISERFTEFGVEVLADIEGEIPIEDVTLPGGIFSRSSLARREPWPDQAEAPLLLRGALRGRGPTPCQQTVRVRLAGNISAMEEVALYFADPRGEGTIVSVDVLAEPARHLVLPVRKVENFQQGQVLRFRPQGECLLRICNRIDRPDPTLSGIAFRKGRP